MTRSSAPLAAEAAAGIAGPHTREWTPRRRPSRTPTTRLSEDWRWPTRVYIVQGHVFGTKRTGAAAMLTFIRANGGRTAISDERPLVTLGGSLPRSDHLEPQSPRRPGLSDIVGHQAGDVEFRHGGQVEPVERASENPACAEILSQGRLEHAAGERAKSKRIGGPELCELGAKAFPPGLPVSAREPGRGELDVGLQFCQRGDDDDVLARHAVTHRFALRLMPEELEQCATADVEHVKRRPRGPGGRR